MRRETTTVAISKETRKALSAKARELRVSVGDLTEYALRTVTDLPIDTLKLKRAIYNLSVAKLQAKIGYRP